MDRVCIALVDASRARLFTFGRGKDDAGPHDNLVDHGELLNAVKRRNFASGSRAGDRDTDGRSAQAAKLDAGFARVALAALRELIDDDTPQRVILCAPAAMLTTLRTSASGILPAELPIEELARDLVALSPAELRGELVAHGLLPTSTSPRAAPSHAPVR